MAVDSLPTARPPRLNPLLFPSDTDFRFVLLIISVLVASLFTYQWLYNDFFGAEALRFTIRCQDAARTAYPIDESLAVTDFELYVKQQNARLQARQECLEPLEQTQGLLILGGLALLMLISGVIYWVAPAWRIRRDKLVRLNARDAPEVSVYLATLCRETALSRRPTFLWNPLNPASSGLAFGRFRKYYVALGGGLVTQFYTDRPAFRAVVLHELAHLRNADVNKTYFAVAVWQGFVVAALVPFAISLVYNLFRSGDPGFVFNLLWRIGVLALLVYLTRNATLRAREIYADVRASVWDGASGALERVLTALPRPGGSRRWAVWRVGRMHPDPEDRRLALVETHRLFRLGFWDALGTGIIATIAFANLVNLLHLLLPAGQEPLATPGATMLFVPLAVGVVGSGVWRDAFAALARGEPLRGAGRLGFGLGLGLVLGQILSLDSALGQSLEPAGFLEWITLIVFNLLWFALLLISLSGFLQWIATGASVWLEVVAGWPSTLRLITALGLTLDGGVLALWMDSLVSLQNFSYFPSLLSEMTVDPTLIIFAIATPRFLLTFVSLWTYPLVAWFWHGRMTAVSEANWAFLDSSPQSPTLPRQPPLRPGLALVIGLVGGFTFCGLLLVARIVLRLGLSETVRSTDAFALTFYYGQIAAAVLIQAGTAAIVAGWVRRVGTWHGLFAAFIAGCVMTAGVLGLNLLFGGTVDAQFIWFTFSQVVNWGALLSLCVAAAMGWLRQLRLIK